MTKQTIKITGLADYSPLTNALAEEYNGLQSNAAKRRLMLDCLRYGYALEKMGLGPLLALLERQDLMALPEHERAERFISMAMSLTGTPANNLAGHQPVKAAAIEEKPVLAAPAVKPAELAPVEKPLTSSPESDNDIPGTKPYQVEGKRKERPAARPGRRLSRPASDSSKP